MHPSFFRTLSPDDEQKFRQWARENYKVGSEVAEVWHPVVQDECAKMNMEAYRKSQGRDRDFERKLADIKYYNDKFGG